MRACGAAEQGKNELEPLDAAELHKPTRSRSQRLMAPGEPSESSSESRCDQNQSTWYIQRSTREVPMTCSRSEECDGRIIEMLTPGDVAQRLQMMTPSR